MSHAVAPSVSETEMTEIVLPQHANALGSVFGGQLMAWMDICGAVAAQRFCGRIAVTAVVDQLVFVKPIRVGDVVVLRSWVNAAFGTSVETEVHVLVEHPGTRDRELCTTAFMTFVALDDDLRPTGVPALAAESDEERVREAAAQARRKARLDAAGRT